MQVEYYVRRLLNGSYNVTKFEGRREPSAVYNLTKGRGHWVCSCPAYSKARGQNCKHGKLVDAFIAQGELVPSVFKEEV